MVKAPYEVVPHMEFFRIAGASGGPALRTFAKREDAAQAEAVRTALRETL